MVGFTKKKGRIIIRNMFNMGSYNSYNLHEDVFVLEKIGMIVTDPRKTLVFYSSTRIKCWKKWGSWATSWILGKMSNEEQR